MRSGAPNSRRNRSQSLLPGRLITILYTFCEATTGKQSYRRGLKFEDSWTSDVECMGVINAAWQNVTMGGELVVDVQCRLTACQQAITRWSRRKFGADAGQLKQKTKQLLELQNRDCPELAGTIKQLQNDIDEILGREDVKWKKRAKQNWYRSGDHNAQYFRAWAIHQRKIN
jgi:hypothetical protein